MIQIVMFWLFLICLMKFGTRALPLFVVWIIPNIFSMMSFHIKD
jgi:hypothetical protein